MGPPHSVGNQHLVRQIPVELQKLFARLLLLDQQSSEVSALTDSFGWKSNEEFQQHDVQELNRILFSAIESSLLGTSGEHLIANLYHGSSVQQECHLRKLPPVLTFALLRFLYDFNKGERYKDTGKFKFPTKLDMSPYCEEGCQDPVQGRHDYELFSVVVHSGSTHSGHYTAIIRDVDPLGTWTHPSEEPILAPADPSSGRVDLIEYENPADLIKAFLEQLGGSISINKICKMLQEQTGVTWNKRFTKQFGPINKFIKSCSDLFSLNEINHVSLVSNSAPFSRPVDVRTVGETTSSNNDLGSLNKVIIEREQLTPVGNFDPSDLGSSEVDVENVSGDTSTADGTSELGSSSDGLMLGEMGGVIEEGEKMAGEGGRGGGGGGREKKSGEREGTE